MAFVKNSCNGVITLRGRTGVGANWDLELPYDLGDVSVSDVSKVLNEIIPMQRRGKHVSDAYGARIYPKIGFTSYFMGGVAVDVLQDFLFRQGTYSTLVGVNGSGRPFSIDIGIRIEGTNGGDSVDWESWFADCPVMPKSFAEAMDGTKWTLAFECRGAVTGSITAAEQS